MASQQTSGYPKSKPVEVVQARAPRVLEHEPQRKSEPRPRGSTDRELWSSQLSWFLGASASALGQRGTMAAVIAAVERGGASGSSDFDHFTDGQLGGPWGQKPGRGPREGDVDRHRRLARQWGLTPLEHQAVLVAHYQSTTGQVPSSVETRFGELAGVVAFLWCRQQAKRRISATRGERVTLQRAAAAARLEVTRLGESLVVARLAARERPEDGEGLARAALLLVLGKLARDALARLLAADAELARMSDQELDLRALVVACKTADPPRLRAAAEKAIREAHRAWYGAGQAVEERELAGG